MVNLTESAVSTLERVLAKAGPVAQGLRIMVTDGGCAGMKYEMGLEAEAGDEDIVLEFGPVKVFIDPASEPHLDGVIVDYVESVSGGGFKFDNPNAASTCGCGKSFSSSCGSAEKAACGVGTH
ncbi:MAG TPA: iron-sulfur cluster assembly accessory protein [Azospirillaceae bacterium]|nr:iron-sulfur cluster assembly accessory protein [Azospirillaceae bacterium]